MMMAVMFVSASPVLPPLKGLALVTELWCGDLDPFFFSGKYDGTGLLFVFFIVHFLRVYSYPPPVFCGLQNVVADTQVIHLLHKFVRINPPAMVFVSHFNIFLLQRFCRPLQNSGGFSDLHT
jgi:hypothetical protein